VSLKKKGGGQIVPFPSFLFLLKIKMRNQKTLRFFQTPFF